MSRYSRFSVNLEGQKSDAFDAWMEESDFEYEERRPYRTNSRRGEFVRWLVEQREVSEDED